MPNFSRPRKRAVPASLAAFALATAIGCLGEVTPPGPPVLGHPDGTSNTTIPSIPGRPFGIRVSNGRKLAVTQQDLNSLTLIDLSSTTTRTVTTVGADPGDVVFNRAGTVAFVSGFNDGTIKLTNAADASVAGSVTVASNAYRLALSPDDTRLYVSSTNGTLYVVNPATLAVLASSALAPGSLQGLALHAGTNLYLTSTNGRVSRLSAQTLTSNITIETGGLPQDIAVTADGSEVAVANEGGWVDVLDGTTLVTKQRISLVNFRPFGLAFTLDDKQIYVTSPSTGQVLVIDRTTRAIVRTVNVGGVPRRVTFTPDGQTALVANESGWVDVLR